MIRMYRILRFYKQLQQSSRRPSVVSGIVRFIPLILCLTHISACIWWYIGTVTIDRAAYTPEQHADALIAANPLQPHGAGEPPLWVHYYSGLGVFELWPDTVAIWKQYLFRCGAIVYTSVSVFATSSLSAGVHVAGMLHEAWCNGTGGARAASTGRAARSRARASWARRRPRTLSRYFSPSGAPAARCLQPFLNATRMIAAAVPPEPR